ncbi:MAG: DUF4386 domain-containing protein [Pseudonocardia sediminis]
MTTDTGTRVTHTRRGGPPLPVPITAYVVLAVAAAVTYVGSRPGAPPAAALAAVQGDPLLAQVSAVLLIGSSVPLAVWAASVTHRLESLGAHVAGPRIGLAGGVLAAGALLLSGLVGWVGAGAAQFGDATLVSALTSLAFALGGVGFALGSALLIAGIAVPALVLRLLPRPLAVTGLVIAVCGAVALLGLVVPPLQFLLPVVRFGGLIWFVVVSIVLPLPAR